MRIRPALLVLALALTACGGGGSGSGGDAPKTTAGKAAPAAKGKAADKPAGNGAKDAKGVNLGKLLGTKADGYVLPPFAKLKDGMTPAEAGKVFPGADKLGGFGFVNLKNPETGVAEYELSYLDDGPKKKLAFVTIKFAPKLTDDAFWNALLDHMKKKLGNDVKSIGDKSVMWIGAGFVNITMSKGITHDGYEVKASLTK